MGKLIARVGDGANHDGFIMPGAAQKTYVEGFLVVVDGDKFQCDDHGANAIIPTTLNVYVEGKKVIRDGDRVDDLCEAIIDSGATNTFAG